MHRLPRSILVGACAWCGPISPGIGNRHNVSAMANVQIEWGIKVPLRDGAWLNATLYRPAEGKEPHPVIYAPTPYIAQTYHDRGLYFARRGYPFVIVDVRGRGNSSGDFDPFVH